FGRTLSSLRFNLASEREKSRREVATTSALPTKLHRRRCLSIPAAAARLTGPAPQQLCRRLSPASLLPSRAAYPQRSPRPSRPHRRVRPCRVCRRGAGGAPQPRAEPAVLVAAGGGGPDTHRVAGVEAGAGEIYFLIPAASVPDAKRRTSTGGATGRGHHVRSKSEGSAAVADWLGSLGNASPETTRVMRAHKQHHHQHRRRMSTGSLPRRGSAHLVHH
ncbi:Os11g0527700, partial [Oryza sativa Japonica Group]